MNYTEVLIDGKIYTLAGDEDEGYMQKVASYINEKTVQLKKQPGFTRQGVDYQTVMVELNMADDYFKVRDQIDMLERQKAEMEKETYSLKHELVSIQMKLEAAVKERKALEKKLEDQKTLTKRRKAGTAEHSAASSADMPSEETESILIESVIETEELLITEAGDEPDSIAPDGIDDGGQETASAVAGSVTATAEAAAADDEAADDAAGEHGDADMDAEKDSHPVKASGGGRAPRASSRRGKSK